MEIEEWADCLDSIRKCYFTIREKIISSSKSANTIAFWENDLGNAFNANRLGGRKAIDLLIGGIRNYSAVKKGNVTRFDSRFDGQCTDILHNHHYSVIFLYHFYFNMIIKNVNDQYTLYLGFEDIISVQFTEFSNIRANIKEGSRIRGILSAELKKYSLDTQSGKMSRGMTRSDQDPISRRDHEKTMSLLEAAETAAGLLQDDLQFLVDNQGKIGEAIKNNSENFLKRFLVKNQVIVMIVITGASLLLTFIAAFK